MVRGMNRILIEGEGDGGKSGRTNRGQDDLVVTNGLRERTEYLRRADNAADEWEMKKNNR